MSTRFEKGDRVRVISPHEWDGERYRNEVRLGDILIVLGVESGMSGYYYYCATTRDSSRVSHVNIDESCLEPEAEEVLDNDEILVLFGLIPKTTAAQQILHKHYLKSSHCAGCGWKPESTYGLRKKFAQHQVEMLKEGGVL